MSLAVGYNLGTWSLLSLHTLQVERLVLRIRDPVIFYPGSEMEKKSRPGIPDKRPGSYFRELSNNFLWLKILKFVVAEPEPKEIFLAPQHCREQ
jgi:hypothetical protein